MHIGILIFPAVTQLDATGPAQVLARTPGATLHMIWKTLDPVKTDAGFSTSRSTRMSAGNRALLRDILFRAKSRLRRRAPCDAQEGMLLWCF